MRLYFDLDRGCFVSAPGVNDRVAALEMKRGDTVQVVLQFCRGIVIQELLEGAAGRLGAKATGDFDGDYVAAATSWVKAGATTTTTYTFDLNLNTEELDELLGVGAGTDVASVVLNFELEFNVEGILTSSNTVLLTVYNDVNRGSESGPTDISPGTPVNLTPAAWSNSLKISPLPIDGDTITIAGVEYTFRAAAGMPHEVQIGADRTATILSLVEEINGAGFASAHPAVDAEALGIAAIALYASTAGPAGNDLTVSVSSITPWSQAIAPNFQGGVNATAGLIGAFKVDEEYLYVVSTTVEGSPVWRRIAHSALS